MKNARKRISALVLALCLVLSMTVPAVWAADPVTYTYDFDYRSFNNGSSCYLSVVEEAIATEYDKPDSVQNWKFKESYNVETGSGRPLYYRVQADGYVSKSGYAVEYLSVCTPVDGYIALTVKTPAAGTYQVSLIHGRSNSGASDSAVYILDKDTTNIAEAIAAAQANEKVGNVNYYSTLGSENPATKSSDWISARETVSNPAMMKTTVGTWAADGEGEHILVFKATAETEATNATTAYMYPTMLTLTPVEASVNGKNYEMLESALSAAESVNSTVVLLNDATVEDELQIPAGVTLNLNGYNLTASSVNASAAGAQIIDSSDGDSILTVAKNGLSGNDDYLPLYDSTGYRFYKVAMNSIGADTSVANAAKLRFQVKFNNADAYALILKGTTGVSIKGTFGGSVESTGTFTYADGTDFAAAWATAANAKAGKVAIVVNLSGLDAVDTLTLTPSVYNAGVSISGTALTAKG